MVFAFPHFKSLDTIDNGDASVRRVGTSIIRGALEAAQLNPKSRIAFTPTTGLGKSGMEESVNNLSTITIT